MLPEGCDPRLLCRVVACELSYPINLRWQRQYRIVVWLEVLLVPGKQEATLTSLRILGAGQHFVQRVDDRMGVNDLLIALKVCRLR
jgi:hypothetical protein